MDFTNLLAGIGLPVGCLIIGFVWTKFAPNKKVAQLFKKLYSMGDKALTAWDIPVLTGKYEESAKTKVRGTGAAIGAGILAGRFNLDPQDVLNVVKRTAENKKLNLAKAK